MPDLERTILLPGGATLSAAELRFVYSRSSGPGGQNVNKVASRVVLLFDFARSTSLSAFEKQRIAAAYPGRVSQDGILRVVASRFRTQAANRNAALDRFTALLTEALTPRTPRRQTRVPTRSKARRAADKAHRSDRKRQRRSAGPDD